MNGSDIISLAALAISIYALYQSSRYRGGDILLAAIKERAELRVIMKRLGRSASDLTRDWKAVLSARGMLHSGLAVEKELLAERLQVRIDELYSDVEKVESLDGLMARGRAEKALARMLELRAQANDLVAAIDVEQAEIKQRREDVRNSHP